MISVRDDNGNIGISSAAGEGDFCLTGAGKLAPHKSLSSLSYEEYRLVYSADCEVQTGDRSISLRGEAVILPAGTVQTVICGDECAYYADFVCGALNLTEPLFVRDSAACGRIEALIESENDANSLVGLTAAVAAAVGVRANAQSFCDVFADVRAYLDKYYYMPCDISSLARAAGYSRGYFTAEFGKRYGCSPYRYATEARIKAAEKLLAGGDLPVSAVAKICGYESAERFIVMFGKYAGVTPLKYRKSLSEAD